MRLTTFSDYTLRVLIFLGTNADRISTIGEVAAAYGISENHLMKVVHSLSRRGYIDTVRGKGGGMRLKLAPENINVGEVMRGTEQDTRLVECFDEGNSDCRIEPACVLKGILGRAMEAFFAVLDGYALSDLLVPRPKLAKLLALTDARRHGA